MPASKTNLYFTQRIRGFQQKEVEYSQNLCRFELKRTIHRCPLCGSTHVATELIAHRDVRGEPMGCCRRVHFHFDMHRINCHDCHRRNMEHIPFLSHSKSRLTKSLERTIIELRQHMNVKVIADFFGLRWHTVKDLEKRYLKKKFQKIDTSSVKVIGVDEIYISRTADQKFLTVIRDLESGAVIHVGDGKGITGRRRVVSRLDETQRNQFKGLRFIFLQNNEDLCEDAKKILDNIRNQYRELYDMYLFKEMLRGIYKNVKDSYHADLAFHRWCRLAEETGIPELKTMSKTIRNNLDGIKTYWTYRHLTNASTEGFNHKIRWLTTMHYGFRDREYFKLKIYQLPEISCSNLP